MNKSVTKYNSIAISNPVEWTTIILTLHRSAGHNEMGFHFLSFLDFCAHPRLSPRFVHPLQDVALHQCLPLSSVCCFPVTGGSLLPCYVILSSSAWSFLDLFSLLGCHSVQHSVHLLSILTICLTHLHFCFSVYSMSIIFVLFLISEHGIPCSVTILDYSSEKWRQARQTKLHSYHMSDPSPLLFQCVFYVNYLCSLPDLWAWYTMLSYHPRLLQWKMKTSKTDQTPVMTKLWLQAEARENGYIYHNSCGDHVPCKYQNNLTTNLMPWNEKKTKQSCLCVSSGLKKKN